MNKVDVVYGPNGEAYLVLRKCFSEVPYYTQSEVKKDSDRVVIIDMFEEEKVSYEF